MPLEKLQGVIDKLVEAQINVIPLSTTDSHCRVATPIHKLRDAGINVSIASNNILNAFTSYGNGDLIQIAMLAIQVAHQD